VSRVNCVKGSREGVTRWWYSLRDTAFRWRLNDIALRGKPSSELRNVACHMWSPVTRHLSANSPAQPSKKRWYSIYLPRKDGGLSVNQCYLSCWVITVIRCWLTNGGTSWRSTDVGSFTHTEQQLSWCHAADVMAQSDWTAADSVTVQGAQPRWRGWSEENSQTQVTAGWRPIRHSLSVDIIRRGRWSFHPQR